MSWGPLLLLLLRHRSLLLSGSRGSLLPVLRLLRVIPALRVALRVLRIALEARLRLCRPAIWNLGRLTRRLTRRRVLGSLTLLLLQIRLLVLRRLPARAPLLLNRVWDGSIQARRQR